MKEKSLVQRERHSTLVSARPLLNTTERRFRGPARHPQGHQTHVEEMYYRSAPYVHLHKR